MARVWLELGEIHLQRNDPEDVDQAQNYFRDSLAEFLSMGVNYYPDIITEKLRQVKHLSRNAIAHRKISEEMVQPDGYNTAIHTIAGDRWIRY